MERKLKCRWLDKRTGDLIPNSVTILYKDGSIGIDYPSKDFEWVLFGGLFTGKTDKNKVEVFEGDIVSGKFYSESVGVVTWLEDRCGFFVVANTVGSDIINRKPFQSAFKMNSCKLTVIGNIFQNKELIK